MKIKVVSQRWFKENAWGTDPRPVYQCPESEFWRENNFISIRHSAETDPNCAVPVDGENILKLRFDDATEDPEHALVLFNAEIAAEIVRFIRKIDPRRRLFVNCGAGISRSGAIGEVLNDYFNRYLEFNALDDEYFWRVNRQIQSNPLVRRILRDALVLSSGVTAFRDARPEP